MSSNSVEDDSSEEADLDYQIGDGSLFSKDVNLAENSELIKFKLEVPSVFKRLSDDIYESAESGIAEPLTNGITAIREAERKFSLNSRPTIEFTLIKDSDTESLKLVIQDNGTGINDSTLRKVLRYIGRSTSRDTGEDAGKYGIGFIAIFKLVGMSGGVKMYTKSREEGEGLIKGIWTSEGFVVDDEGMLPNPFDEGEYGTRFELLLKEEFEVGDIREWVRNNYEFARVPVLYTEQTLKGDTLYQNEWGEKSFTEDYDSSYPVITIENEYYKAVMSPEADSKTILLDVPVRRNHYTVRNTPWKVDIRFKNENGVIINGPNEGLSPTNPAEYENMAKDRREKYVSQDEINGEHVTLPEPTGTRDTLERNREFWDTHLGVKLKEKHHSELEALIEKISEPSDIWALSHSNIYLLMDAVETAIEEIAEEEFEVADLTRQFEARYNITLKDDISKALKIALETVYVVPEDENLDGSEIKNSEEIGDIKHWKVVTELDSNDVYMGVSINNIREEVIREHNSDNLIVKLEDTSNYEYLSNSLGWKKIKNVKPNKSKEYDISEETREKFENEIGTNNQTDSLEQNILLNFNKDNTDSTVSVTAMDVKSEFERYVENGYKPSFGAYHRPLRLVLFPDSSEYNVSDYYNIGSYNVAIARCPDKLVDYLIENEKITTFKQYKEQAQEYIIETHRGEYKAKEIIDECVFLLVSDSTVEKFRRPEVMSNITDYITFHSNRNEFSWRGITLKDDYKVAPITQKQVTLLRPILNDSEGIVMQAGKNYTGEASSLDVKCNSRPYAISKLLQEFDSEAKEVEFFEKSNVSLDEGAEKILERLLNTV